MIDASSPSDTAFAKSAVAYAESTATSTLSATAFAERTFAQADKAARAEATVVASATMSANTKSARAAIRAADFALALIEAIHAKIEDTDTKIFQATLESSMQPTSEKVAQSMEHLLSHEFVERELEMQELAEIEEHREEELRVGEDKVYKILSIEESVVEYQRKL
ncbi:hypothetical protein ZWY2020_024542 [Hordeum vulgare]|nr:hypothetical protein ZWY2020_024542 [Hordeum vulgare]